MSTSTRSSEESQSSPAPGDAPAEPVRSGAGKTVLAEVELELSRQRLISWAIFGTVVGALLVWKLGTVGVWAGIVLIVLGVFRAYQLVQTFRHPPGTFRVTESKVTLPRGLCLPRPIEVAPQDVTAAYFLRRSVPWNRSAPVLVVEVGKDAFAYPRDWFASEPEQRRLIEALLHGRVLPATADKHGDDDHRAEAKTSPA